MSSVFCLETTSSTSRFVCSMHCVEEGRETQKKNESLSYTAQRTASLAGEIKMKRGDYQNDPSHFPHLQTATLLFFRVSADIASCVVQNVITTRNYANPLSTPTQLPRLSSFPSPLTLQLVSLVLHRAAQSLAFSRRRRSRAQRACTCSWARPL